MPDMIRDGRGQSNLAAVNDRQRLLTSSVSVSLEHFINLVTMETYQLLFSVTPVADVNFLYMRNLSENTMLITGMNICTAANEKIKIKYAGVSPLTGGTVQYPTNLNYGSKNAADGTFLVGNDITSNSDEIVSHKYFIQGGVCSHYIDFVGNIAIPKNTALTMSVTTGSNLIEGHILFAYNDVMGEV